MDCRHTLRSVARICVTLVLSVAGLLMAAGVALGAEVMPSKGGPLEPNTTSSGWLELVAVFGIMAVAFGVVALVSYILGREGAAARRPVTAEGAAKVGGGFRDPKAA